ncbi:5148_t:CDS:2 [Entrophospora sp. SA101]|nr:9958_t:CDS:2 [Entrophospora sp. SA101]CAJ0759048.1 5148_t:CDS:2 [Entrophospora sp. SA101]CAJ0922527.1 19444_t:CDS:2 [Entrophospora sp. SA101]
MNRDNLSMVKNPFMFLFWSIKDQHNYKFFLKIISKFEKKDLQILKLNDIEKWSWVINHFSAQVKLQNIIPQVNLEELLDYNNPLASSIIYTSE